MTEPTPETLRVFELLTQEAQESIILQFVHNNRSQIDPNYMHMLSNCAHLKYAKLMKLLLNLGAEVNNVVLRTIVDVSIFSPPIREAKELMTALLNAGCPNEIMLYLVCANVDGTHKELLGILLEQPIYMNYIYNHETALHRLIRVFSEGSDGLKHIFMDMLRMLLQKGANPNEVNKDGQTAFRLVNKLLAKRNPGPILQIMRDLTPVIPVINYKDLWEDELKKSSPTISKLEEYKHLGRIDISVITDTLYKYIIRTKNANKNISLIESLLKWGADPNKKYNDKPMFFYIFSHAKNNVIPLLTIFTTYRLNLKETGTANNCIMEYIDYVSEPYSRKISTDTITNEQKEVFDLLIENGADIHYSHNIFGYTIDIFDKCLDKMRNAIEYFLEKGISPLKHGRTRFYYLVHSYAGGNSSQFYNEIEFNDNIHILQILMKYHTNHNDYFKDFLDACIFKPNEYQKEIYDKIKHILSPNYNQVYRDGSTPLIKAVQLYAKTSQRWVFDMIEDFLEKDADKNYMDSKGKKAIDYTSDTDLQELLGEHQFNSRWTTLPKNAINAITMEPISEGQQMVNFHGEMELGRFYKQNTYRALRPKLNPFTRRNIVPKNVMYYSAHLEGGKRSKRVYRKTRKVKTCRKIRK